MYMVRVQQHTVSLLPKPPPDWWGRKCRFACEWGVLVRWTADMSEFRFGWQHSKKDGMKWDHSNLVNFFQSWIFSDKKEMRFRKHLTTKVQWLDTDANYKQHPFCSIVKFSSEIFSILRGGDWTGWLPPPNSTTFSVRGRDDSTSNLAAPRSPLFTPLWISSFFFF